MPHGEERCVTVWCAGQGATLAGALYPNYALTTVRSGDPPGTILKFWLNLLMSTVFVFVTADQSMLVGGAAMIVCRLIALRMFVMVPGIASVKFAVPTMSRIALANMSFVTYCV